MGVTTWSQDVVQPASDLRQRQRHPLTTCPDHRNGSPGSSSGDRCRRHLKFDPLAAAEFDTGSFSDDADISRHWALTPLRWFMDLARRIR